MNSNLLQQSVAIILMYQDPQGGYIACPNFVQYTYYWLRDGAYTAYAMDVAGETDSAARFHTWVVNTLLLQQEKIENCIEKSRKRLPITPAEYLHCRFNADGSQASGDWAHHQLDGLAAWLWAFGEHCQQTERDALLEDERKAVQLAVTYLQALWGSPCYDSWEEDADGMHTYTLAAIYGGLTQAARLLPENNLLATCQQIKAYILENLQKEGRFIKSSLRSGVDANLLGLLFPFQVISQSDATFQRTLETIEDDLVSLAVGLHRYRQDVYYGGGEWVLLSAWLGIVYAHMGQCELADRQLRWVEAQFTQEGFLPEQVSQHLLDESQYQPWVDKWGPIASPLLWSHAMHILLAHALQEA